MAESYCQACSSVGLSRLNAPDFSMAPLDGFATLARDRRSTRAFLPTAVTDGTLHELLSTARRAPSGANLQPGGFIQVHRGARRRLCHELLSAWREGRQECEDYEYFPQPMPMTLRKRQVASAQALYGALDVARGDRGGRDAQFERNFRFFEAPVALIVTIDRDFGPGGYMDLGMTLYGLMMAAQSRGMASCAIGAMASFPSIIRQHLGLDERTNIVCGMALGFADPHAPVNRVRTTRCAPQEFFRQVG
jgi:nitroreductase